MRFFGRASNVAAISDGGDHAPGLVSRARRAASGVVAMARYLAPSRIVGRKPAGNDFESAEGTVRTKTLSLSEDSSLNSMAGIVPDPWRGDDDLDLAFPLALASPPARLEAAPGWLPPPSSPSSAASARSAALALSSWLTATIMLSSDLPKATGSSISVTIVRRGIWAPLSAASEVRLNGVPPISPANGFPAGAAAAAGAPPSAAAPRDGVELPGMM